MQACLHPNPEKRASCSELLRLPYLANVEASFTEDFLAAQVGCTLPHTSPAIPSYAAIVIRRSVDQKESAAERSIRDVKVHSGVGVQAQAQERLQQRAAAAKLRKHKRKSADLEPPQPTASFSLTASAHTHVADAPRCPSSHHLRCTHLETAPNAASEDQTAAHRLCYTRL